MEETFRIENDKTADWAIQQIKDTEAERDRLVELANSQIMDLQIKINELNNKCENDTRYLKSALAMYFETVQPKETKTQKTYKLLSGTLVFKKPSIKINHDDDKLVEYLENNDGKDYIKIKKSVDWAEFKKNLFISDSGEVVDSDIGVVIDKSICSIEEIPASFDIK